MKQGKLWRVYIVKQSYIMEPGRLLFLSRLHHVLQATSPWVKKVGHCNTRGTDLTLFKPTIQDLYTAVISQHLDLMLLYADWTCREINSLTHSHLVVLILFL